MKDQHEKQKTDLQKQMSKLDEIKLNDEEEEWCRQEAERTGRPLDEIRNELLYKKREEEEERLKQKEKEPRE